MLKLKVIGIPNFAICQKNISIVYIWDYCHSKTIYKININIYIMYVYL